VCARGNEAVVRAVFAVRAEPSVSSICLVCVCSMCVHVVCACVCRFAEFDIVEDGGLICWI